MSSRRTSARECFSTAGAARVVLPGEARPRPHLEVALLAAEPPDDLPGALADLVDGARVPRRDDQRVVRPRLDRVDVEVVVRRRRVLRDLGQVRLVQRDVPEAVPLEEDAARRDVDLLEDRVERVAVARAADGAQVLRYLPIDRDQRRPLRREQELVLVAGETVPRAHLRDPPVGAVGDLVAPLPDALRRAALPPREHRPALVALDAEVGGPRPHRVEPDDLAVVFDDQRPRLGVVLLRREEEIPGSRVADAPRHLEDGGLQVGAAVEVLGGRHRLVLRARPAACEHKSGRKRQDEGDGARRQTKIMLYAANPAPVLIVHEPVPGRSESPRVPGSRR